MTFSFLGKKKMRFTLYKVEQPLRLMQLQEQEDNDKKNIGKLIKKSLKMHSAYLL